MSTLRLTTIANQTGSSSVPSDTVINGSAKAWVNFNGTGTVAIRASFNVSSITDNGVGNYTVNFSTAFSDLNYATVAILGIGGTGTAGGLSLDVNGTTTTSAKQVITYLGNSGYDSSQIQVAVFR